MRAVLPCLYGDCPTSGLPPCTPQERNRTMPFDPRATLLRRVRQMVVGRSLLPEEDPGCEVIFFAWLVSPQEECLTDSVRRPATGLR